MIPLNPTIFKGELWYILELSPVTHLHSNIYTTDSEDEAKAFIKLWGGDGSYSRVSGFPTDYFRIEI